MKKYFTLLFFIVLSYTTFAQNWIEINNNPLTKSGRTRNKGFSINGTGYVLGGSDDYNYYGSEAWAYDTATKSWSAIQTYPDATGDDGKSTVAVDSLGYSGLGGTGGFAWTNSWYSYSKTLNQWTPLTFYPGSARAYAATFAIGGEIYVAGGMNGSTPSIGHNDFYKYDIASNTWRQMASCPDSGVNFSAVAFTLGGKGYVCTGASVNNSTGVMTALNEVWEYDPSDSTWTKKNPFPGGPRTEAMGWATCDKGYLGGGYAVHSPQTLDSDFWEYDPTIDTWTQIANYGGGNLDGAATFVIGKTGYVCGGQRDSANYQQARGYVWTNDDWSYTKIYTPTFSTSPLATICAGQSITFTDTSNYSPDYRYWQFPGGNPDTSTSKTITVEYDDTGDYNITLTAWNSCDSGTQTYTNYVTVGKGGSLTIQPPVKSVCNGQSVTLSVTGTAGSFVWAPSAGLSGTTGDSVIATPSVTTTYTVTSTDSIGCQSTGIDTITVIAAPPLTIQSDPPSPICLGQSIILSVPVSGTGYTWGPSSTLSSNSGDSVTATPNITTVYTISGTDSLGCSLSALDTVSVNHGPEKPTISESDNVLTSSATQGNQWVRNDTILAGATNQTYTVAIPGYYQVTAKNPVNGCSTTSDSVYETPTGINQLSAISEQLSVYPNPTSSELFVNISSSVSNVKEWTLQITDVLGRMLYSRLSLNYNNDIDLSNLPGGVYFIAVINKTERAVVPVVKGN
jgi:N-acetylneuraminic acid mutarotase